MREQIFANQKRLGVIPPNTKLTDWPTGQAEFGGAKLPTWDSLKPDEKKLFARQAETFAAYVAYTDYEIGRVVQEVEDLGKLDNTLIIYISGDNGTSAEGSLIGTPFDLAALQGVDDAGRRPAEVLRCVGLAADDAAHGGPVGVGVRYAVQVDQADRLALRRHAPGHGDLVARPHQRPGRHPHPVPPPDRHRADDPRGDRHRGAEDGRRHRAEADRGREHGVHVRQGQRERQVDAHDPVLRDDGEPRDLSRRMDRDDDAACRAVGAGQEGSTLESYKWELYNIDDDYSQANDLAKQQPDKLRELQQLFLAEAQKYQVLPLDNDVVRARAHAPSRATRPAAPSSPTREH